MNFFQNFLRSKYLYLIYLTTVFMGIVVAPLHLSIWFLIGFSALFFTLSPLSSLDECLRDEAIPSYIVTLCFTLIGPIAYITTYINNKYFGKCFRFNAKYILPFIFMIISSTCFDYGETFMKYIVATIFLALALNELEEFGFSKKNTLT